MNIFYYLRERFLDLITPRQKLAPPMPKNEKRAAKKKPTVKKATTRTKKDTK